MSVRNWLQFARYVRIGHLQSGAAGFDTGKGEKLSNSQAGCLVGVAWMLFSFSPFPVLNPAIQLCSRVS